MDSRCSLKGLRKAGSFFGVVLSLCLSLPAVVKADTDSELATLKTEVERLHDEQQAMKQELLEIKQLLSGSASEEPKDRVAKTPPETPPLPMQMSTANSPYLGDPEAPVVLFEFTDYHCPFCRRHFEQTYPRLVKEYVESGKLKIILKEFPIQKLHPLAARAAMAAQCAGGQDKYWPMHDLLFQNQRRTRMEDYESFAASLDLDTVRFMECMERNAYADQIRADFDLGVTAGVRGTPFFFIGPKNSANLEQVRVERYLFGAQPFDVFKQSIEAYLDTEHSQAAN
ncbi:thioredoxin [Marinobacterium zhoushanense]|uniref:Thioredoxin n=1 Tax=Marinobacterium zhoushanense TaxID=1679163 RepID=A0ABQ1KJY5_9GAMM|nr:thioredoxin domain-containing protein [Marinobacterium zhoushanense]GGC02149.1 thioredoxin [Marinobacterium zhoushanense]